jgi:hypothetical protein
MTGEGLRNGDGYEHAGGYRPAVTFTPREIVIGILIGAFSVAFAILLDTFVPPGPPRTLFHLVIGVALLVFAGWEIFRTGWRDIEHELPDPTSLLYPERVYDDAMSGRRRRLIWAAIVLVGAVAILAHAALSLLETGVPVANLPAVILIATALLIAHLAAGAHHRRRRLSSTE